MPFPLLAHQVPILPLKPWRPHWFCGTALVVGSIAPDLGYAFRDWTGPDRFGHRLADQFTFCLPVSLALVWLLTHGVIKVVARYLPHGAPYFLEDLARIEAPRSIRDWVRAAASVLIASASHVALDGLSHRGGWLATLYPGVAREGHWHAIATSPVRALQYLLSAFGCVIAIWVAARWGRTRMLARLYPDRESAQRADKPLLAIAFIVVAVAIGAVVGFLGARKILERPWRVFDNGPVYVWGFMLFRVICFGAVGLIGSTLLIHRLQRRSPRARAG